MQSSHFIPLYQVKFKIFVIGVLELSELLYFGFKLAMGYIPNSKIDVFPNTPPVLPFTPLTHVWRKSKDLYHLVLLYNIHFKIIRVMFTYLSNGYVLVNATRCIITREECEEIKANLI